MHDRSSWKRLHTPNQHIGTSALFIQSSQLPNSLSNMQISSKAKALSCFHRAKYNPLWSDAGFIRSMEETYGSVWGSVIWLCYYGVTNYWQWLRKKLLTSRQKTITNKSLVFSICHQYLLYVYISMFQAKFNRFCNINTFISWPMYYNH